MLANPLHFVELLWIGWHGLDRKLPRLSSVLVVVALSEGAVGLRLPVILFCIYFLKSFHRFLRLRRVSRGRRLEALLSTVAAKATTLRRAAIWWLHQLEWDDSGWVIRVVHNVMSWHWLFLRAHALPVDAIEEWVRFKRVVTTHSNSVLRLQLQKLVNEALQLLIMQVVWPLELTTKDFVEDDHFSTTEKRRLSTCHLIQNDAKGPEIREGARLSFI